MKSTAAVLTCQKEATDWPLSSKPVICVSAMDSAFTVCPGDDLDKSSHDKELGSSVHTHRQLFSIPD
ncbi:hypothetical protein SCP_0212970 [Sparassis crispa]|uniref:Uncharacterized protein n=1 Tax=Sparassis crispa TaxID=139825 RepID=A0A401GD32_9APHY|nr:hypothetical protein SCP_0212970 [Sparassis crispa]GBE80094.1 hypothetical protein SCP_0212970 [Sparassis crispa]